MVAPPLTERDASAAGILSRERSKPASPELRIKAPVEPLVPSTSSENRRANAGAVSFVSMASMIVPAPVSTSPSSFIVREANEADLSILARHRAAMFRDMGKLAPAHEDALAHAT